MKQPNFNDCGYYGYPKEPRNEDERFISLIGIHPDIFKKANIGYNLNGKGQLILSIDSVGGYISEGESLRLALIQKIQLSLINIFVKWMKEYQFNKWFNPN